MITWTAPNSTFSSITLCFDSSRLMSNRRFFSPRSRNSGYSFCLNAYTFSDVSSGTMKSTISIMHFVFPTTHNGSERPCRNTSAFPSNAGA